jgi:hypothetical protein
MKGKNLPGAPLEKGGELEPGTWNLEPVFREPGTQDPLSESLAWLDYCLGETILALEVAKGVAKAERGSMGSAGETPAPLDASHTGKAEAYHAMCEAAAGLITLRGRASRGFRASCPVPESRQADET